MNKMIRNNDLNAAIDTLLKNNKGIVESVETTSTTVTEVKSVRSIAPQVVTERDLVKEQGEVVKSNLQNVLEEDSVVGVLSTENVLGKEFKIYGTVESPLFLAKDIARWIEHSDVSTMLRSVDEDEKVTNIVCTLGGNQKSWFLTENGLYEVLMLSRKPIAKEFKKEVKKVLHSLRVNGGYIKNQENLTPEQIVANALVVAQKIIADRDRLLEEQKPKVEFADKVLSSETLLTMSAVCKVLGLKYGCVTLYKHLVELGVLNQNHIPYQEYISRGYFKVCEGEVEDSYENVHVTLTTKVYQKGVNFIMKLLQKNNLLDIAQ